MKRSGGDSFYPGQKSRGIQRVLHAYRGQFIRPLTISQLATPIVPPGPDRPIGLEREAMPLSRRNRNDTR